jgi:hypothetical protein
MTVTAADYAWTEEDDALISQGYCITLARGLTTAQFLSRLAARAAPAVTGFLDLCEASYASSDHYELMEQHVGVISASGDGGLWAVGVQVNGYIGVTEELVVPLSAGTAIVSHYQNINAVDQFYWVEDRIIRLEFEPLFPSYRQGSTPDVLVQDMMEVGFDLSDDGDNVGQNTASAFALAERLTGVRITLSLLQHATYECGIVKMPAVVRRSGPG